MKFKDINFIARLNLKEFFEASRRVEGENQKTRKKVEKPFEFKEVGAEDIVKRIAAIGAAYLGLQAAQESFRRFQTNLTNVATLGVNNIEELSQGVLRIGIDAPVALEQLEKGLYDVVSAGVDASSQLTVLETSAKAAKAGLAETSDALGLASAVIKAYGKDWSETEGILDRAFKTVELGSTTFKDLSTNIQNVTPIASALGIGMDELFGSFATLTGVTGNTAIVSTQLRAIFTELAKPTDELNKLIQKLGFSTVEAAVKQEGLSGILQVLQAETEGSASKMTKLFSSTESVTALLALTGAQYDTFINKTDKMTTATNAMSGAFDKQAETLDSRLQLIKNRFEVITIGLLEGSLPALTLVVDAVSKVVGSFASLNTATQQTVLGITGMSVVLAKLPAIIAAVRTAITALNTNLGPTGWLILGIGAVTSALIAYTGSLDETDTKSRVLERTNQSLARSFNEVRKELEAKFATTGLDELIAKSGEYEALLQRRKDVLQELFQRQEAGELQNADVVIEAQRQLVEESKSQIAALKDIIAERRKLLQGGETTLTEEQQKELDKRREYEFQTNRISLEAYIAYLQSRKEAQREALGAESVEFLKFTDKIADLQKQLAEKQGSEIPPLELQVRIPTESALEQFTTFLGQLREVETEFRELGFQDLQLDFETRQLLFDNNLEILRQKYGEDSEAYRAELQRREEMQQNFNNARIALEHEAALVLVGLGNQLMNAFAGQSGVLFGIGKTLALAEAGMTTAQAIQRAFKDYPWPFNIGIAAIQGALAFAQVQKITKQQFKPDVKPVAFAQGGKITQADIVQSLFTPAGESGIVAVRAGEFIMPVDKTQRFLPILEAMRSGDFDRRKAPGFADGGLVGGTSQTINNTTNISEINYQLMAGILEDAIITAFNRSKLTVDGTLTGEGKELQAVLDKEETFKTSL